MADVNVTVQDVPILISVQIPGIQGPAGSIDSQTGYLDNFFLTTGDGDARYLQTGVSGFWYPYSNPNFYVTSGNLTASGAILYGYIVSASGLAGGSGVSILSGNLFTTGQNLYNLLSNYTGYNNTNPSGYALNSSLQSTGISLLNIITNSGAILYNYLRIFSGNQQSFSTGINPTGYDNYRIDYPLGAFTSIPRILTSIEVSGNVMYHVSITGRSTSSFYSIFSDIISESGVILHILATTNN